MSREKGNDIGLRVFLFILSITNDKFYPFSELSHKSNSFSYQLGNQLENWNES